MPLYQARDVAKNHNLDLVEVAPTATPPVCRLLDYGKYKYEQAKKEREARKGTKTVEVREVRLRPKIGTHDFDAKARLAKKLLDGGDKVKVTIQFRGREITHPELGLRPGSFVRIGSPFPHTLEGSGSFSRNSGAQESPRP